MEFIKEWKKKFHKKKIGFILSIEIVVNGMSA